MTKALKRERFAGALLLIGVCLSLWQAAGAEAERVFSVEGKILQLSPITDSVVVAHDEIEGFMPAMTMPFNVKSMDEVASVKAGDRVQFEFVVGDEASWARNFKRIEGKSSQPSKPTNARSAAAGKETVLREGDHVPDIALTNQSGNPVGLAAAGRTTVVTFIFTRCPVPEYCPLMAKKFFNLQGLAQNADGGPGSRLRLLSITLDPEFDVPDVLRAYGEAVGADFQLWEFATGKPAVVDRLASAFRVFRKQNGAVLDHTLCTALVDADGRVVRIWRGNVWEPAEVMEAARAITGG